MVNRDDVKDELNPTDAALVLSLDTEHALRQQLEQVRRDLEAKDVELAALRQERDALKAERINLSSAIAFESQKLLGATQREAVLRSRLTALIDIIPERTSGNRELRRRLEALRADPPDPPAQETKA